MRETAMMFVLLTVAALSPGCGGATDENDGTAAAQGANDNALTVGPERVVSMHFTVHDGEGKQLESSAGGPPFQFLFGGGVLPPLLEMKMQGLAAGESVEATLPPNEAFGQRDETLVVKVPREHLANIESLTPGMQLEAKGANAVTVLEVADDVVTIDENHPWAGLTLRYTVNVVAVREAAPEELAHGHVHGPGGVEHAP